jgi:putative transposase
MLILIQRHLCTPLRDNERHYNAHPAHRGISNARRLYPLPKPITSPETIAHLTIRRRKRLGGLPTKTTMLPVYSAIRAA